MFKKLFFALVIFAICNSIHANSNCILTHTFKTKCVYYKYSDDACQPGLEESTCHELRVTYNDFNCPQYQCVSKSKMCYSRDSFCICCYTFIRILTLNRCSRNESPCPAKTVYPKTLEKCSKCLNCQKFCSLIEKGPRKWRQPNSLYVKKLYFDIKKCAFAIDAQVESE